MKRSTKLISVLLSLIMLIQCFAFVTNAEDAVLVITSDSTDAKTPAYAVQEIISKREQNVKHFKMSDGTFSAASYSSPVHYLADGEWQDIDNSLVAATDSDDGANVYQNTSSDIDVKFAKKSNSKNIVKLTKDGYKLSFSLLGDVVKHVEAVKTETASDGDMTTLEDTVSTVRYNGIYDGVDIEYVLSGQTLKENIIINKKLDDYSFSYEIKANGLTLSVNDGAVVATDGDKQVFVLPAPFMLDGENEYSDSVSYSLTQNTNGKYILTVTADSEWINSPDRSFPVTIDPTIMVPEGNSTSLFEFATSSDGRVIHASANDQGVENALRSDPYNKGSLYLKFALPYLDGMIYHTTSHPTGYGLRVVGAELYLGYSMTINSGTADTDAAYSVHNITETWQSNFTYETKPAHSGFVEGYLEKQSNFSTGWFWCDISELVSDWYSGARANNGIYITPSVIRSEDTDISYLIYAHDSTAFPRMLISYVCSIGIENYFTYTSTDLDGLGTASVNNLTGALNYVFTDIASSNSRNGMPVYHVYNDEYTVYDMPVTEGTDSNINNCGDGFKLNIQQIAYKIPNGINDPDQHNFIWCHLDEDGTIHYYEWDDSEGVYVNSEGLGSKLRPTDENGNYKESSTGYCEIEFKSGTKYWFDQNRLAKITDTNQNKVIIEWTGVGSATGNSKVPYKVREILADDGTERVTTLTWNDDTHKLTGITGPDNTAVQYTYSGDNLTSATFTSNKTYTSSNDNGTGENAKLTFGYENVNGVPVLTSASNNITGKKTTFTRNSGSSNSSVNQFVTTVPKTGSSALVTTTEWILFDYSLKSTTVEDNLSDGYYVTYFFNNLGQTVEVSDSENSTKQYKYTDDEDNNYKKNKITFESLVQGSTENFVSNGRFKDGSTNWSVSGASIDTVEGTAELTKGEYISQAVNVQVAGAYTFSAKILSPGGKARLSVLNENGNYLASTTTLTSNESETYNVTLNMTALSTYTVKIESLDLGDGSAGYVTATDVQLVKSKAPTQFNLLNNTSFNDDLDDWTVANTGGVSLSGGQLKIVGDYLQKRSVKQTVAGTSFEAEKTYLFGASYRSLTLKNLDDGDGTKTALAITAEIRYYDDSTDYETIFLHNNTDVNYSDGNYLYGNYINQFGIFKPTAEVEEVILHIKCDYNFGAAYFDNIYIIEDSAGSSYSYDDKGNLTLSTNAGENSTGATYNSVGDITSVTDPLGNTTQYEYDSNRNVTNIISPDNIKTTNVYDSYGNVTSSNVSKNDEDGTLYSADSGTTTYNEHGTYVTAVTDSRGNSVTYDVDDTTYSVLGETSPVNQTVYDYYNSKIAGLSTYASNMGPIKSVSVKDTFGNLLKTISYEYDEGGLEKINRGSFSYKFDETYTDSTTYMTVYDGDKEVDYSYLETIGITDSSSASYAQLSKKYYNSEGLLTALSYDNGDVETYQYDIYGRPVTVFTDSDTYSYVYDMRGNLAKVSEYNTGINTYFEYDALGRTANTYQTESADSVTRNKYEYNANNQVTTAKTIVNDSSADGDFRVNYVYRDEYTYNNEGNVEQITRHNSETGGLMIAPVTTYGYNPIGMPDTVRYASSTGATLANNFYRSQDYLKNSDGEYTSLVSEYRNRYNGDTSLPADYVYRYTYDNVGNITRVDNAGLHYGNYNYYSYQYDALNQLTHSISPINGYEGLEETFSYVSGNSNVGNIQQRVVTRLESGYANETDTYNYTYDSVWSDKLLSVTKNGTAVRNYSYLGNGGTPSTDGNFSFNWSGRRLTSVYDISEQRGYSYTYDYSGRRISKQYIDDNGNSIIIKYYYTGDRLSSMAVYNVGSSETYLTEELRFEYDATGVSFINHIVYGDGLNSTQYRYWVVRNIQGDVTALVYVDSNGNAETAVEYYYSAFGEVYVDVFSGNIDYSAIAQLNPIRYRGYFYDTETGFYYLDSRYYDPEIGRFINRDRYASTGQGVIGTNMFTYCNNNPVNFYDPSGMFLKEIGDFFKKIGTDIYNGSKKVLSALAGSLQIELGFGYGLGISGKVGPAKLSVNAYQDGLTVGLKEGSIYTAIQGEAGIVAGFSKSASVGIYTAYEHRFETDLHRDTDEHTTMSPPWEVYDCPKTIKDPFQFSFPIAKPIEGNISDDLFIGIGIGAHLGIGGHASIGFNANKFWKILTE